VVILATSEFFYDFFDRIKWFFSKKINILKIYMFYNKKLYFIWNMFRLFEASSVWLKNMKNISQQIKKSTIKQF